MKKTILPALAMLIISAVMLSTASYAWFAMSTEVSATNMSVSIKSDSSFLMIASQADVDGAITADSTLDTLAAVRKLQKLTTTNINTSKELLPTAHDAATGVDGYNSTDVWYTKVASDPTKPDAADSTKKSLTTLGATLDSYVLANTFYIAVAEGSNTMEDLKARVVISNTGSASLGDPAIRVLIVTETASVEYSTAYTFDTTTYVPSLNGVAQNVVDLGDVTANEAVKVNVYIYYDGNDDNIYTTNLLSIAKTSVNVFFTAKVGSQIQGQ